MPTKYKVYYDEKGQISTQSRIEPIDAGLSPESTKDWKMTPELLRGLRPVEDEQFKAYDPETGDVIDVRTSDASVRSARMRHALKMNPYKALGNGFFAGEQINDANDNFVFNLLREAGRTPVKMTANIDKNAELMLGDNSGAYAEFNIDTDELKQYDSYRDALIEAINVNNAKIDKRFGKQRDGFASDLGSGIGSLGTVVAMSALGSLAGPAGTVAAGTATAGLFGLDAGSAAYQEALAAGVDDATAWNMGALVGASNAALERIGLGLIWKSAGKKIATRVIHGFATEFSEEMSQGVSEDIIMNKVRGKSIQDILADGIYQGLIGGIVGVGAGAVGGGNINDLKKELVDRGLSEQQADALIAKTDAAVKDQVQRSDAIKETLEGQVEQARFMNENFDDVFPAAQSVAADAFAAGRRDVDIRDDLKQQMVGVDETKQNIIADLVQSFADKAAEDFGHTQREILEKTGLQVRMEENAAIEQAQEFEDGTKINENGELVGADGKVLFQRVGQKGASENEKQALAQAVEMEKLGYDNDSIKKSTGWSRGLDDQWWLETSGDYSIKMDNLPEVGSEPVEMSIVDVVGTDNYRRYPELQNLKVVFENSPNKEYTAAFDGEQFLVNVPKVQQAAKYYKIPEKLYLARAAAHEIDHYIARQEGFESGGSADERVLTRQVQRHAKRYYDALQQLGLADDVAEYKRQAGRDFNVVDGTEYAIQQNFTQDDLVDVKLKKRLNKLRADAYIYDRYGRLYLLNEEEKQQRIKEAYTNTIGEIYARRASNVIGFSDNNLRTMADENPESGALSGATPPGHNWDVSLWADTEKTIKEELAEFAAELQQESGHRFNQSAFAGSRVDYDTPSLEAIGTGEGNQAHGYGLYYALNKDTAERYRTDFDRDNYFFNEEKLSEIYTQEERIAGKTHDYERVGLLERLLTDHDESNISEFSDDAVAWYKKNVRGKVLNPDWKKAQVHEVDIPESPFLLDEQKNFARQSKFVKDAIKSLANDYNIDLNATHETADGKHVPLTKMAGRDLYENIRWLAYDGNPELYAQQIGQFENTDKEASQLLNRYGIKGITYDGQQDGRCFVIFSADDVRVIQKFYDQNDQGVRGYFDWTDKMHQIIQIMKTGDIDTVVHELGHFFSVNYINMAIESGKTENIQPLLEYYKVEDPRQLMTREDIQEDLAVKFISYIKTDQSPRGFRKYFDACKDWLITMWDKLKQGGFVQDGELPDEIVRFFDNITIAKPKNLNLDNVQREKMRLKQILREARTGKLQGISDADMETIEELMKAATARIPRMPKSLFSKLWGSLNTKFAETHDLAALMGVDDKYKHLMTRKQGGISNENDLVDFLIDEGFMFGDTWDENADQGMRRWNDALDLLANARNQYSVEDSQRVDEIQRLAEAKEAARDILEGQDSYDARGWIEDAKSALQRVNDAEKTARMRQTVMEKEYAQMSDKLRKVKNNRSELRAAFKSAVNFLAAQDLPTDVKNKLYKTIHQVHDTRSLAKWMQEVREKAADMYSAQINKAQREKIKNELSETFTRNKRNIKYDYENNRLFTELREIIRMKTDDAQKKLMTDFYIGEPQALSRQDELRKMLLEYVANDGRRGGMSAEFMDELIGRIQEAKLIGRDAIDDIQFERGVERLELHEELLDAIAKNKPGKVGKAYINWVANWKSMVNSITNKEIAEKFDMVPKQTKSQIDNAAQLSETMAEVLDIYEIDAKNDAQRNHEFMKWRSDMTKPIEGLRVWYKDHNGKKTYYDDNGQNMFSRDNIINMYNQYKDQKSRELMDMFYGADQIEQLFTHLTEADIAYADYLMERVSVNYHDLNKVYVNLYQKDMPRKLVYWPRRSNHETDHDLMEMFNGAAAEPNFTKSRSHGSVPVFWMGAWDVYSKHIKDSNYMINEATTYKQIADMFGHSTVQNAIKAKFGKEAVGELNNQIEALSLGGLRKIRNQSENIINDIFGQIAGAKVFLSPFVMIKQLTSFGGYATYMPAGRFYTDFAAGVADARGTYKFMMEHAGDYIKNRFTKGNNETLSGMIDALRPRAMDRLVGTANRVKFNNFLSLLVRTGDIGAVVYGGYPRLKYLLSEKKADGSLKYTHEQAVQQFIVETEEAQQSSQQAALSNFQRNGNLKLLAMFKNSQAQYLRKIVDAKNMMERGEISKAEFAKITAIFGGQMAVMYWLAGELLNAALYGGDDDDKDLLDWIWGGAGAMMTTTLDAIPVFGNMANATLNYATGKTHKIGVSIVGVDDIMQSLKNVSDFATSSSKRDKANMYFWAQTISPLIESTTGAPVSRYNRFMKKTGIYDALGI